MFMDTHTDYKKIFAALETISGCVEDGTFAHSFSIICEDEGYHALCEYAGMRARKRISAAMKSGQVLDFVSLRLGGLEITATAAPRPAAPEEVTS